MLLLRNGAAILARPETSGAIAIGMWSGNSFSPFFSRVAVMVHANSNSSNLSTDMGGVGFDDEYDDFNIH